jgi:hypothetical protein
MTTAMRGLSASALSETFGDIQMNAITERLMDEVETSVEMEIVELGEVSEETRGMPVGYFLDAGFGRTFG